MLKICALTLIYSTESRWINIDKSVEEFKGNYTGSKGNAAGPPQSVDCIDEVAFLQYTSGSTSEPKGVMISHSNLAHNEKLIQAALQTDTSTVNVSWLPQYHDVSISFFLLVICEPYIRYLHSIFRWGS